MDASLLFNEIDLNKDGLLEKSELESALLKYSVLTQEQVVKRANLIFMNIDTDNNGYIENEEFIKAAINPSMFWNHNYFWLLLIILMMIKIEQFLFQRLKLSFSKVLKIKMKGLG